MHLDQLQRDAGRPGGGGMDGLYQRRLAHAACAPQQHVVGRQPPCETLSVVGKDVADMVDAADQTDVDAVRPGDRLEELPRRHPDEALGGVPVVDGGRRAGEPLDGRPETCDFLQKRLRPVVVHRS
jgi:hypothetical protein